MQLVKKSYIREEKTMKKLMIRLGNIVAMLAVVAATLNVNATCSHHVYQEPVPDSAKRLSKL